MSDCVLCVFENKHHLERNMLSQNMSLSDSDCEPPIAVCFSTKKRCMFPKTLDHCPPPLVLKYRISMSMQGIAWIEY